MKKISIPVIFIVIAMMLSVLLIPTYAAEKKDEFDITIMNQNVAGLPIPALFSSNKKVVSVAQVKLGKLLNECGCDVVCVQEDFQYHALLALQMTNYPYQTQTSGGVPLGDGLNIYSKYPIYNVVRVTWEVASGILTDKNDALTPKGFLKVTILVNDKYIDIYNIHTDAGESDNDFAAKRAQFKQLTDYIKVNSVDNPVIVVGDFNAFLHNENESGFYDIMIKENKFVDAWAHVINNDDYFRGNNASASLSKYYQKYSTYDGYWDSIERLLTKSSASLNIESTEFSYVVHSDNSEDRKALTDHSASYTKIHVSEVKKQQEVEVKTETPINPVKHTVKFVKSCKTALNLIFKDLCK